MTTKQEIISWLKTSTTKKVVLVEITGVLNDSGNSVGTLYFSNKPFGTTSTDTPANTIYTSCIVGGVTFSENIDLDGQATIGFGDIELDNTNGIRDSLLNWVWTNKSVTIQIGDASWSKSQFYTIFSGYISDVDSKSRNSINLILVDKLQVLNTAVIETTVESINPNAANKDELLPVCLGECFNVSPVLLLTAPNYVYQVNNTAIQEILEVRDIGGIVPINTDLSNGRFSLQRSPVGEITASIQGAKYGSPPTYYNKIGKIIQNLLLNYGKKISATNINTQSFDNFDTTTDASVGIYLQNRENVLDICQKLASSVGGTLVTGLDGKFKLVQVNADYTGNEAWSVSPSDMEERSFTISEKLSVQGAIKLNYCKNWTVQTTGLAQGLKPEVAALFGKDYHSTTQLDVAVLNRYAQSTEPVAKDTYLLTTAKAASEASRLLNIYKTPRFIYTAVYYSHMLLCELGDIIKVTYPRFGLANGKYGTIVQINRDWLNGKVSIGILI